MSRANKVNPDHYKQAGRLTPDEAARERMKQKDVSPRRSGRANEPPSRPGPPTAAAGSRPRKTTGRTRS
jgi:hypothetical protein